MNDLLGIVKKGMFIRLVEEGKPKRLNSLSIRTSVPLETGEISLFEYEGKLLRIQGEEHNDCIFTAVIISVEREVA